MNEKTESQKINSTILFGWPIIVWIISIINCSFWLIGAIVIGALHIFIIINFFQLLTEIIIGEIIFLIIITIWMYLFKKHFPIINSTHTEKTIIMPAQKEIN